MPKNQRQQAVIIGGAILVVLIGLALIFGGDSGLFGTGADEADSGGAVDDSSAPPADDSSAPPADDSSAPPADDSSAPPADSGGAVDDSSAPPADSGGAVDDSSAPPADSGGTGNDTTGGGTGNDTTGGDSTGSNTGGDSTGSNTGADSTGNNTGEDSTGEDSTGEDSTGEDSVEAEATAEAEATVEVAALAVPVASFGINDLGNGTFEFFDNSFAEGIASYTWDFGDGTGGTGSTVQHTFAADGSYSVTLVITSADGYPVPSPDTQTQVVLVTLPLPTLTLDANASIAGLTVNFSATATSDRGAITTWNWVVNGTSIGTTDAFTYTFASAGTYTVTVTATDEVGNPIEDTLEVTVAPSILSTACVPSIQSDPNNPLQILASIASSENIASFTWNFGDGSADVVGDSVSHVYAEPAVETNYTITLVCTPVENGAALDPITGSVTISPLPGEVIELKAQFAASPFAGPPGTRFIFSNQSTTGASISYSWDVTYPDGSVQQYSSTDLDLTLTAEGVYNLTLTVSDGVRSVKADGSVEVVVGADKPIPDFILSSTGPLSIEFMDNSSGGEITTWAWEVRDDSGAVLATFEGAGMHTYTFASAIRYTVYMKVVGPGGEGNAWKTREIISGGTVTADFEVTKVSNLVDGQAEVCFRNTSSNAQESYWSFDLAGGEEVLDNGSEICHVYTSAGLFTARLRVVGQNGDAESEKLRQVSILTGGTPPVALFTASGTTIRINQNISFTNQSSNAQTWLWEVINSSDNVIATNTSNWNWNYTFTAEGTYKVRLTAYNEFGEAEYLLDTISVTAGVFSCVMPDADVTQTVYPTQYVTYRANISNLDGRSYTSRSWAVTDEAGTVISSNTNSSEIGVTWSAEGTFFVKFEAELSDGSRCSTQRQVSVESRELVCSLVSGNFSFIPGQSTTIQVQVNEEWRNTVVYEWTVNDVVDGSVTGNTYTVSNITDGTSYTISAIARITSDTGSAEANCNVNINGIEASYPGLVCNSPDGSRSPLLGSNITYTPRVDNIYGRTITYGWRLMDGDTEIANGTGTSFAYAFSDADSGKTYTLYYWAQVGDDAETRCGEKAITINVNTSSYICSFVGDSDGNDTTPARETSNYTYKMKITSSRTVSDVTYSWTFIGIDGSTVYTTTTTNGQVNVQGGIFKGTDDSFGPASVSVVASGNGYDCQGTLSLRPGDWRNITLSRNFETVQVGEQVCVTNNAEGTWFPIGDAPITYELFVDRAPAGVTLGSLGALPFGSQYCTTATATGTYRFYLQATTVWGLVKKGSNASIGVVTRQGISATANPESVNTEALVTFTAVGTNIDTNSYVWTSPIDGSTKRGAVVTFRIPAVNAETDYTFTVTGQGTLGQSNASVVVKAFPSGSEISADFEPNTFGIIAGEEVCFTDQSSASAITWSWDFGDGSDVVEFTEETYQAVVCHTYNDVAPGENISVTLRVTNADEIPASARNTLRVLNELEGASSFGVDIQGGGKVCYTAQISEGVSVSGWDFDGDGQIDENFEGTLNAPCFIYAEDGKYLVRMNISQGQNSGYVEQQVNVNTSVSTARPSLAAVGACEIVKGKTVATFTVRNLAGAGAMQTGETVTITASDGSSITAKEGNALQPLEAGESQTFTVEGYVGRITFTFTHRDEQIGAETTCDEPWDKSSITVSGACIDRVAIFTITNSGDGDMAGISEWRLYQMNGPDQGSLLKSGTFKLDSGSNLPLNFTATDLGLTLADLMNIRLVADQRDGHPGNSEPRDEVRNCGGLPSLSASGVCLENAPVITVINSGVTLNAGDQFAYSVTFENGAGNFSAILRAGDFVDNQATLTLSDQYGGVVSFVIPGHVSAEAEVGTPNCNEPELSVSGICTEDGTVAFVITNAGGPTVINVVYSINDTEGSISVPANTNVTIDAPAPSLGTYVFTSEDAAFPDATAEVSQTCLPAFSVSDSCWDGGTTHNFTVVNDAKYAVDYTWEVGGSSGEATAAVGSNKLTVTDLTFGSNTLVIKVNGEEVANYSFSEDTRNCNEPEISANGVCEENAPVINVTASNWLPNDSVAYLITYETGETQEGTFSGADLEQGTFTVPDVASDKGDLTFEFGAASNEAAIIGNAVSLTNCNEPVLLAYAYCSEEIAAPVVEIINDGGNLISTHSFDYIITYENGQTSTGTITAASFTDGVFLPELSNQNGRITNIEIETKFFSLEGLETTNCNPAELSLAGACEGLNEGVSFTVTNIGGPMMEDVDYEVVSGNMLITSGTITGLLTDGSQPISVDVTPAAYGTYTLSLIGEGEAEATIDQTCLPELGIETACWSQETIFSFNVINDNEYNVEYTWVAGIDGISVTGSAVATPGSTEVTVEGLTHGRGYVISLLVADEVIRSADMPLERCQLPDLEVAGICNEEVALAEIFVTNVGGPIFSTDVFNYTVDYARIPDVSATFTLADMVDGVFKPVLEDGGNNVTFILTDFDGETQIEVKLESCNEDFTDDGGDGSDDDTLGADDDGADDDTLGADDDTADTNDGPTGDQVCGGVMPALAGGLPGINLNTAFCGPDAELGNGEWQAIVGEPAFCPDWLAYHTNQVAPTDWEIFALGDIPNRTLDNNLSRGTGDGVFDFFPARSPDAKWIAFASNRDGNWELYTVNVETGFTQRATVNTESIDVDPVWSPDQRYLAYESNVDGNWEIRLLDLATGESRRLTDHPGNDLNPFFSPDSTKIVFQSDRAGDGNYQIYELDLASGELVLLSDGQSNDVDPQYSNDGEQIAFRSIGRDDANPTQSGIFVMNADGSDVLRVSPAGGDATNHAWSPQDNLIAYQSNLVGGVFDIYTYDFRDGQTRLVTFNEGDDYAPIADVSPTWFCDSESEVIFTSFQTGDNNIYSAPSTPEQPVKVDEAASQMTTDPNNDRDPQNSPLEENASRGGSLPPSYTASN